MAKGNRHEFEFLSKLASESRRMRLFIGMLTMILSFELLAGQTNPACRQAEAPGQSIAQVFRAAREHAVESYRAFRLAYELQRRVNDLEKQDVKATHRAAHMRAHIASDRPAI